MNREQNQHVGASSRRAVRGQALRNWLLFPGGLFLAWILVSGCDHSSSNLKSSNKLSAYIYEDTRQLVSLVEDAAGMMEKRGVAAFDDFAVKDSKWLNDTHYLFAYDISGKCLFHPMEPALVGQDLMAFKDFDKRPVIALITEVGNRPEPDAGGWIFYLWEETTRSHLPRWKSSYVRKAIGPDGAVYLVGSGLYDIKMERVFIIDRVDKAADLIVRKGKEAAFAELSDRSCPLHILGTYITVANSKAEIMVDPAFPALVKKRSIADFRDKTGRLIAQEIIRGLDNKDAMWLAYIWPQGEANRLDRHTLYVRKVKVDGEFYYVMADFVPATPVWMKQ